MVDPLLAKALRDLRGQIIGWGLALGALQALIVAMFPTVADQFADVEYPEAILAFFGNVADFTTIEGWLVVEFFSYAGLILSIFAIIAGTAALAGEENEGTMDMLLSQPVTRTRLLIVKVVSLTIAIGVVVLMTLLFTLAAGLAVAVELPIGRLLGAFGLLWYFVVVVALISVALSVLFGERRTPGILVALLLVASYLIDSMANLVTEIEVLRPALLHVYYQADDALVGEVRWGYTIGLGAVLIAALLASRFLFQRCDIGVERQWILHTRLRRKVSP